ncbi:MAG: hypothetical protein O8C67_04970 [Candidatus Methanoperedens sp.]|nr:hypothetical protein [Candidatus Methanoperedens sp.]
MANNILKPLEPIYEKKQEIESKIKNVETRGKNNKLFQVVMGVDHTTLSQAILADIIDALPIVGEVTNVSRIRQADDSSRRFIQGLNLSLDSIPPPFGKIADAFFPANTISFIDKELKRSK